MHLKIERQPSFAAEVTATQPTLAGPVEVTFQAKFRALRFSELEAYGGTAEDNERFLRDVLLHVDVVGDDEAVVPWSESLRDQLIDTPWLRTPLMLAYRRALTGAARGN